MPFDNSITVAEMAQAMGLPQGTIDRLSPAARQLTKEDLLRAMGASNGPEALEKYRRDPSAAESSLDLSVEDVHTIQELFAPTVTQAAPGEGAPRDFNCCCCAPCCCSAVAVAATAW